MKLINKSQLVIDSSTDPKKLISILLKNRQVKDLPIFLKVPHPKNLTAKDFGISSVQLNKAIARIKTAIKNKQKILIYGDYDVDGISATALLWLALNNKNADVTPFVPHRQKDGYGFNQKSYTRLATDSDLIITVDNGIVAQSEINKVKSDFIIVDHHLPEKTKPKATALIHSAKVCAAALSWFLAKQLDPSADLALAALGTVADCLPLLNVNRSLVKFGLRSFATTKNHGLKKLMIVSGLKADSITAGSLGFILGPRINAIGRLGDPTDALRLFCAPSPHLAQEFAQKSNSLNLDRQQLQTDSIEKAQKLVKTQTDKLLFVVDKSFHPGIIGLIAGRLSQDFYLPSIAVSIEGTIAKGSCRSIPKFNIISALRQLQPLFIDLGGHTQAAGFSIQTKNLKKLQQKLTALINQKLKNYTPQPSIEVDAAMKLSALSVKNCQLISKLAPFGIGNPHPLFVFKNLKVVNKRLLGQNQNHLKLKLDDPDTPRLEQVPADAIAFRQGYLDGQVGVGDTIDLVAQLDLNVWGGRSTPQLIVKNITSLYGS